MDRVSCCRVTDSNLPDEDVACCTVQEQAPRPLPGLRLPGQDHQVLGRWHWTLPLHSGQFASWPPHPSTVPVCLSLSQSVSLCPCLCHSLSLALIVRVFVSNPASVHLSLFVPVSVCLSLSLSLSVCLSLTIFVRLSLFLLISSCCQCLSYSFKSEGNEVTEARLSQYQGACSYHSHIGKVAFLLLTSDIYWH